MSETATATATAPAPLEVILDALKLLTVEADTQLLSREDVCARLSCGRNFFYEHVEPNLIRFKESGLIRYTRASVDAYIRAKTVDAAGVPVHKRAAKRKS